MASGEEAQFITTSTGTKIHRKSTITRPELLNIGGGCTIQAGAQVHCFPRMSIGQAVVVDAGAIVRAPPAVPAEGLNAEACLIGDAVYIGPGCVVEAKTLGSHVYLEAGCVVGRGAVLHDGVRVGAGAVVPPDTVAMPGTVLQGLPARPVAVQTG